MESEKVKEIKKALECCCILTNSDLPLETRDNACNSCPYELEWCTHVLIKNALSVINELENENERLLEQRNKTYNIWVKDTKELKARIAGLEGKLEAKEDYYNAVKDRALEVFANKLKAEIPDESTFGYLGFNAVMEIIDETLKELQK